MFGRKKSAAPPQQANEDIEMNTMGQDKKGEEEGYTEYRPVNWKKLFFSPKYIRKCAVESVQF